MPASATWRHLDARVGFEVVFLRKEQDGYSLEGHSTAVEDGVPWGIRYAIAVDPSWRTRSAHVVGLSELGTREVRLEAEGNDRVADRRPPRAARRRLPGRRSRGIRVHERLPGTPPRARGGAARRRSCRLRSGRGMEVERLEQSYARLPDVGSRSRLRLRVAHVRLQGRARLRRIRPRARVPRHRRASRVTPGVHSPPWTCSGSRACSRSSRPSGRGCWTTSAGSGARSARSRPSSPTRSPTG